MEYYAGVSLGGPRTPGAKDKKPRKSRGALTASEKEALVARLAQGKLDKAQGVIRATKAKAPKAKAPKADKVTKVPKAVKTAVNKVLVAVQHLPAEVANAVVAKEIVKAHKASKKHADKALLLTHLRKRIVASMPDKTRQGLSKYMTKRGYGMSMGGMSMGGMDSEDELMAGGAMLKSHKRAHHAKRAHHRAHQTGGWDWDDVWHGIETVAPIALALL